MKFCNKCGKENSNSSNFCESCGNDLRGARTNSQSKKTSNLLKYVGIGVLALIVLVGGFFFLNNNSENSTAKADFMKKYESAIALVNQGDFEKGKSSLNEIKDKDEYDDVDVNSDIKVVTELDKIQTAILNEEDGVSKLVENFETTYKGKFEKMTEVVDKLTDDAKEYGEYSETLKKLNDYKNNKDYTNAETELKTLKGYKFKLEKISDKFKKDVEKIEEELENVSKESSNNVNTNKEVTKEQVQDYPAYALIPNLTPDQPMPITYADIRGASDGWILKVKMVIEGHLGKPLVDATNKEIESAILSISSRNGFAEAIRG